MFDICHWDFVISMSPKLIFILGQTATGKTARAVALAKKQGGELINCDSRQIYRELNIITGKTDNPTDVPMHLVDVVSPNEPFSAFDFAQQGIVSIQEIVARGKVPIVVGGTGNYVRMLLYLDPQHQSSSSGLPRLDETSGEVGTRGSKIHSRGFPIPTSPSATSRRGESGMTELTSENIITQQNKTRYLENLSKQDLQQKLMQLDNDVYSKLNPSDKENPRRLIRAIQRTENDTGEILDLDSPHALANQFEVDMIVLLHKDQESLHARISKRVDERLSSGAVEECRSLLEKGYKPSDPGLATIGYQSIFKHLAGVIDYETMKTEWAMKERQYAKRQKTYLLKYFPQAEIIKV